ncbi:hypothetical protein DPMN_117882 [Dreissena polymorpha]|uniref:Uncharacterized protein n=1 Tax=Dreissena polymorpha TaxID=45954 RepID=A0A9D4JL63_DREPO|nr:hypothetical protein DPMN_117882 [Dreissena polymorpha]
MVYPWDRWPSSVAVTSQCYIVVFQGTVDGTSLGQVAIISRCNFTVFSEAVKKCCYTQEECKVAFVGGTDNFGFPMLMDMYSLLCPQNGSKEGYEIKNKFIKMFPNFKELEKFAVKSMDVELQGKIKIVKTYHTNLPILIRKIDSKCVKDERTADYVFSTAHKAKGLEFSTVRLTDDFMAGDQQSMFVTLQNLGLDMEDDEREERGMQDVIAVRADCSGRCLYNIGWQGLDRRTIYNMSQALVQQPVLVIGDPSSSPALDHLDLVDVVLCTVCGFHTELLYSSCGRTRVLKGIL